MGPILHLHGWGSTRNQPTRWSSMAHYGDSEQNNFSAQRVFGKLRYQADHRNAYSASIAVSRNKSLRFELSNNLHEDRFAQCTRSYPWFDCRTVKWISFCEIRNIVASLKPGFLLHIWLGNRKIDWKYTCKWKYQCALDNLTWPLRQLRNLIKTLLIIWPRVIIAWKSFRACCGKNKI